MLKVYVRDDSTSDTFSTTSKDFAYAEAIKMGLRHKKPVVIEEYDNAGQKLWGRFTVNVEYGWD